MAFVHLFIIVHIYDVNVFRAREYAHILYGMQNQKINGQFEAHEDIAFD